MRTSVVQAPTLLTRGRYLEGVDPIGQPPVLSGPEHVDRSLDGRAVEIPDGVLPDFRGEAALRQLAENRLQLSNGMR